jgi:hypothetical protein
VLRHSRGSTLLLVQCHLYSSPCPFEDCLRPVGDVAQPSTLLLVVSRKVPWRLVLRSSRAVLVNHGFATVVTCCLTLIVALHQQLILLVKRSWVPTIEGIYGTRLRWWNAGTVLNSGTVLPPHQSPANTQGYRY